MIPVAEIFHSNKDRFNVPLWGRTRVMSETRFNLFHLVAAVVYPDDQQGATPHNSFSSVQSRGDVNASLR